MTAKTLSGEEYVFVDVKQYPEVKKVCFCSGGCLGTLS